MTVHLTKDQPALAHRLRQKGDSLRSIAKDLGLASPSGELIALAAKTREAQDDPWTPGEGRACPSTRG